MKQINLALSLAGKMGLHDVMAQLAWNSVAGGQSSNHGRSHIRLFDSLNPHEEYTSRRLQTTREAAATVAVPRIRSFMQYRASI